MTKQVRMFMSGKDDINIGRRTSRIRWLEASRLEDPMTEDAMRIERPWVNKDTVYMMNAVRAMPLLLLVCNDGTQ